MEDCNAKTARQRNLKRLRKTGSVVRGFEFDCMAESVLIQAYETVLPAKINRCGRRRAGTIELVGAPQNSQPVHGGEAMSDKNAVVLYARVSSQQQAQEETISSQVTAIRQRISDDNMSVYDDRCFLDDGFSGACLLRPGLERLRDLAAISAIDRVYIHSPVANLRPYFLFRVQRS